MLKGTNAQRTHLVAALCKLFEHPTRRRLMPAIGKRAVSGYCSEGPQSQKTVRNGKRTDHKVEPVVSMFDQPFYRRQTISCCDALRGTEPGTGQTRVEPCWERCHLHV